MRSRSLRMPIKALAAIVIACIAVAASHSCAPDGDTSSAFKRIPQTGWTYQDTIDLRLRTTDSITAGALEVAIRHNSQYPYSEIWLEVANLTPGHILHDTLRLQLADGYGRWLGKGFGNSFQCSATLPHHIVMADSAVVAVRHIMRTDTLKGIEAVGIIYNGYHYK